MVWALALRGFRAGFAALVFVAIAAQINTLVDRGTLQRGQLLQLLHD